MPNNFLAKTSFSQGSWLMSSNPIYLMEKIGSRAYSLRQTEVNNEVKVLAIFDC
ncbi:MAG: hypothetical protein MRQ11_02395 [Candidatus Midichloria mitochondrii]|nr:hypothetical protein [Candidatus Midichloria mitochondrii]